MSLFRALKSDLGVAYQLQSHLLVLRVHRNTSDRLRSRYLAALEEEVHKSTGGRSGESGGPDGGSQLVAAQVSPMATFLQRPRLYDYYNLTSTTLMVWLVLKYIFNDAYRELSRHLYGLVSGEPATLAAHCYDFGHYEIHSRITDETFGSQLALYHLAWRLMQHLLRRPHQLDVIWFLLQPREEIERFANKFQLARPSPAASHKPWQPGSLDYHSLSARERFLAEIMCYRLKFRLRPPGEQPNRTETQRVLCRLRPNRTVEARDQLVKLLTHYTSIALGCLLVLLPTIAVYMLHMSFLHDRYINNYHDCFPHLGELYNGPRVPRWSWQSFCSGHRLVVWLADTAQNTVVWTDTGLAIILPQLLMLFLSGDLMIYWRQLHASAQQLARATRLLHGARLWRSGHHHRHSSALEYQNQKVYQLQAMLADLARQIQLVDLLVSDVISSALIMWVSGFAVLCFRSAAIYSASKSGEYALICVCVILCTFVGYVATSLMLLTLQSSCRSTYPLVCTIMALDQSVHKQHFVLLMDSYTNRNRNCFTYFHLYPFNSSNFFSLLSWSIPSFLFLDTITRPKVDSARGAFF